MPPWPFLGLSHLARAGVFQLTTTPDLCLPATAQCRCSASDRLWQPALRLCRPADGVGGLRVTSVRNGLESMPKGGEEKGAREGRRVVGTAGPRACVMLSVLG